MRIFVDANILISVLNKEYPLFPHSSRILSVAARKEFEVFTFPIYLAIAFYCAEKKLPVRQDKSGDQFVVRPNPELRSK